MHAPEAARALAHGELTSRSIDLERHERVSSPESLLRHPRHDWRRRGILQGINERLSQFHKKKPTFRQVLAERPGNYFFAVYRVIHEMFVALHPDVIFIFGRCGPH